MSEQKILSSADNYAELDAVLADNGIKKLFLVCDRSIEFLAVGKYFEALPARLGIGVIRFSDFVSNPTYDSVAEGVRKFRKSESDLIVAVGGGSAMDVAKCIKLYSDMNDDVEYIHQEIVPNDIRLLAVPTTAGTGSEATRYAVIYYNGEKQSITHDSCLPSVVLIDPGALSSLPMYQRKVTMLDALCHAIESYWSVNSNDESKEYSREAIQMVLSNMDIYLDNDLVGNANMLKAAHIAGKAINITQTTAGHAMAYKLTSLYGISHGHAVAICVATLWRYMLSHTSLCIDPRGEEYLSDVFSQIATAMGCESQGAAMEKFWKLLDSLSLERPSATEEQYGILKTSVNPVRLKNNPVRLDEETIDFLYHEILK